MARRLLENDQTEKSAAVLKLGGAEFITSRGLERTVVTQLFESVRNILLGFRVGGTIIGGGIKARERQRAHPDATAEEKDWIGIDVTQENAREVGGRWEAMGIEVAPKIPKTWGEIDEMSEWAVRRALKTKEMVQVVAGGIEPGRSTDAIGAVLLFALAEQLRRFEPSLADCPEIVLYFAVLSNVDGLFTADPKKDSSAEKITDITLEEIIARGILSADPNDWEPGKSTPIDPVATQDLSQRGPSFNTRIYYGHGGNRTDLNNFLLDKPTQNGTIIRVT